VYGEGIESLNVIHRMFSAFFSFESITFAYVGLLWVWFWVWIGMGTGLMVSMRARLGYIDDACVLYLRTKIYACTHSF
jgi:hypothetical protein